MRNSMRRTLTVTGVLAVAFTMASAATAATDTWGPRTSYYKSNVVVEASGSFWSVGNTAKTKITVKDRKADGNEVFAQTKFYWQKFQGGPGDRQTVWTQWTQKTGDAVQNTTVTSSFSQDYWSYDPNGPAEKMRTASLACADMGWPVPDSCTSAAVYTRDY